MSQYRGLVNEGSTCYLNSLLQTLFMTPEFRRNVYDYVHDERKISASNSIPYQLQKLFVLLQLNQSNVYSRGLLKSFQWNQVDSFQQHDVQEFCRILFQALQKASKNKGKNWIEQLYSGVMQSFISCGKHPRSNQEIFMDISLPIRSQYKKVYYRSIQQCLKQYLRPQNLEDKIQCEGCGQKVNVQKGMRIANLPPILTLQINRFELNYENMQRYKVNSFLYFPQILEMWRYLVPFQKIEQKGLPKDLYSKVKLIQKQKSARATDFGFGSGLVLVGKKIQRKQSFQVEAEKKKTKFYDEQNRDKRQDQTKKLTPQEQKMKNMQILKDLKAQKDKLDNLKKKNTEQKTTSKQQKKDKEDKDASSDKKAQNKTQKKQQQKQIKKQTTVAPPSNSIEDDMLFGTFMDGYDRTEGATLNQFDDINISVQNNTKRGPKFEKTEPIFQHQQQSFNPQKQYPQNTYILYSILVHSGGAYGGHYYAYIFNGIDWYCFNDNSVKKVNKQDIRKYGHPLQESSYGANAYLLFYRQAQSFKNIMKQNIEIPPQLLEKVLNDKTTVQQQTSKTSMEYNSRFNQIQNSIIIKVKYKTGKQLQTLMIPNRFQQTLSSMKKLIKQLLKVTQDDKNWRLRRYNKSEDSMHQVYDTPENQNKTLDEIGLRQTIYLAIDSKKDNQVFQDYDPKNIVIKLNVWREDLTLLTETFLKPAKIWVRQQTKFEDFYKKVGDMLNIRNPVIIKRNFSVGNPYNLFQLEPNKDKTLISLKFFNGINLYVQQPTSQKLKWQKQFEDQKYKCQIKFNNPKQGHQKNLQIFIDTRKTLNELKQRISQIIGIPVDQFRIKKSQQAVSQMATFKKRLIDLKFVNVQYLYIEEGRSSKGTIIVRKGLVAIIDDQINFSLGQQFQVEIQQSVSTVADLKVKLQSKYGIPSFLIRVREYKAHQFGQIIQNSQSLVKIREKSLIWQELQIQDPKGLQVYIRIFDLLTLQLGPLLSLFVESSGNYQQLALLISQQTQIQQSKILVHKSPSNFVDKSLLFQCQWAEIRYLNKPIRQQPLYLASDGDILIVKAAENSYHPRVNQKGTGASSSKYQSNSKSGNKQAALKITVIEQKQIQEISQKITEQSKQESNKKQQKVQVVEQKDKLDDNK